MPQEITPSDLVFDDKTNVSGYMVDNILHGGSNDEENQKGGSALNVFKDLAVPAGLLLTQHYAKKRYYEKNDVGFLTDDLHERLLKLVDTNARSHSKTRKRIRTTTNKSKKKK